MVDAGVARMRSRLDGVKPGMGLGFAVVFSFAGACLKTVIKSSRPFIFPLRLTVMGCLKLGAERFTCWDSRAEEGGLVS